MESPLPPLFLGSLLPGRSKMLPNAGSFGRPAISRGSRAGVGGLRIALVGAPAAGLADADFARIGVLPEDLASGWVSLSCLSVFSALAGVLGLLPVVALEALADTAGPLPATFALGALSTGLPFAVCFRAGEVLVFGVPFEERAAVLAFLSLIGVVFFANSYLH